MRPKKNNITLTRKKKSLKKKIGGRNHSQKKTLSTQEKVVKLLKARNINIKLTEDRFNKAIHFLKSRNMGLTISMMIFAIYQIIAHEQRQIKEKSHKLEEEYNASNKKNSETFRQNIGNFSRQSQAQDFGDGSDQFYKEQKERARQRQTYEEHIAELKKKIFKKECVKMTEFANKKEFVNKKELINEDLKNIDCNTEGDKACTHLKNLYRKLARLSHPDKSTLNSSIFQELNELNENVRVYC
jgi:hypothetical protein